MCQKEEKESPLPLESLQQLDARKGFRGRKENIFYPFLLFVEVNAVCRLLATVGFRLLPCLLLPLILGLSGGGIALSTNVTYVAYSLSRLMSGVLRGFRDH